MSPRLWMSPTAAATETASGRKSSTEQRRRDQPIQGLAHEVFQLQRRSTVERRERQRLDGWQTMQRRPEIQLVFEPLYLPGEGVISVEHPEDDLVAVRLSHRPVNTRSSPLMKLLTKSISLGALFHSPPRSGTTHALPSNLISDRGGLGPTLDLDRHRHGPGP